MSLKYLQTWEIEDVGPLVGLLDPTSNLPAELNAVNDGGVIVGTAYVMNAGENRSHAFLIDSNNTVVDVHPTNAIRTSGIDINNANTIIGQISMPPVNAVTNRGYIRNSNGTLSMLKPIVALRPAAQALSNQGRVVGYESNGPYHSHALSWGPPEPTATTNPSDMHPEPYEKSTAVLVSDIGHVAGFGINGNVQTPLLFDGLQWQPMAFAAGDIVQLSDINIQGSVVGSLKAMGSGPNRAFLYEKGMPTIIPNTPDVEPKNAKGISDGGEVVGDGFGSGVTRAFIYSKSLGVRRLDSLPTNSSGWTLRTATAISPSGWSIVGEGTFAGQQRIFRMTRGIRVVPSPEPPFIPETWMGSGSGLDEGGVIVGPRGPIPIPPWVARLQNSSPGIKEVINALLLHEMSKSITDAKICHSIQTQLLAYAAAYLDDMKQLAAKPGGLRDIKRVRKPSRISSVKSGKAASASKRKRR